MEVWLDDESQAPDGWERVYWPQEAIELLDSREVSKISLDHDLGNDDGGTGYDVLKWIEEKVVTEDFNPPKIYVHSANISAKQKIQKAIDSIERLC